MDSYWGVPFFGSLRGSGYAYSQIAIPEDSFNPLDALRCSVVPPNLLCGGLPGLFLAMLFLQGLGFSSGFRGFRVFFMWGVPQFRVLFSEAPEFRFYWGLDKKHSVLLLSHCYCSLGV